MTDESTSPKSDEDAHARLIALEERFRELEQRSTTKVIHAELKAEAIRAGMIDLDGLKLIETSGLRLTESGAVDGVSALMQNLRQAKPWLFGTVSSSSSASPPAVEPPRIKLATEMSVSEWQAARAALLKRR